MYRCWGEGCPELTRHEHNQAVPGVFLWASYLGGLGALGREVPGAPHGPEHTGCTSPSNGPRISRSWPEPDVDSESFLGLPSSDDLCFPFQEPSC